MKFKKSIVKAAAVQIAPVLESKAGTLGKVADAIIEAGKNKADIIVCLLYTSPSPRDRG